MAWLHDGCWIQVFDIRTVKRWKTKLSVEVERVAGELGIPTWLDAGAGRKLQSCAGRIMHNL